MQFIRFALRCSLFLALFASASMAQSQRTFVSGGGSDGNPCSRTAPCRTFGTALTQTNPGGEIYIQDSAGYGPFVITKAVSVIAPQGVAAGISVFSGDGVTVNAGGADTVLLRGLIINNQGSAGNGIVFDAGATLHVESCLINGFSSKSGILFAGAGKLEVKDCVIRNNFTGIDVQPLAGNALASVDQVRLEGNAGDGIVARENSKVTVRNSVASGGDIGFDAATTTSAPAELNVENCMASNNTSGIVAQSTSTGVATVRVSNSIITDNSFGLDNFTGAPAVFLSRGNNTVEGNTTNTTGTIGSYSAK